MLALAVGSPHILQLSGVGVPLVHELRGVGRNMQDHYVARVSYPVVGAQTANERSATCRSPARSCAG